MNATGAVVQALQHHQQVALTPTGHICSCGALIAPFDFDLHVARQVLDAIEDATGQAIA